MNIIKTPSLERKCFMCGAPAVVMVWGLGPRLMPMRHWVCKKHAKGRKRA